MSAGFLLFLVVVLVMPGNKAALETEGVFHVLPRFLNEDGKRTIQREREGGKATRSSHDSYTIP